MKIAELINRGIQELKNNRIENANIKARMLLQYVLKQDKSYLISNYMQKVEENDKMVYEQYIQEMIQGKPLQYITKAQEFMGLNFYIDENVLIPQPDTEILVEETIKEIEKIIENKKTIGILDMCTGSGAIAVSIANYFQEKYKNMQKVKLEIYAVDISEKALEIAKKNADTNQVKITCIHSDMFKELEKYINEPFDIIVSNPPYIETEIIKTLPEEVQREPHIALDGGQDGLMFYKIIAQEGSKYLSKKRKYLIRDRI